MTSRLSEFLAANMRWCFDWFGFWFGLGLILSLCCRTRLTFRNFITNSFLAWIKSTWISLRYFEIHKCNRLACQIVYSYSPASSSTWACATRSVYVKPSVRDQNSQMDVKWTLEVRIHRSSPASYTGGYIGNHVCIWSFWLSVRIP